MKSLSAEDASSEDENVSPMKTKRPRTTEHVSDCEDGTSAYEQLRIKNIREREKLMRGLGISSAIQELKAVTPQRSAIKPPSIKPPRKTFKMEIEALPRRELSRRLRNLAAKPLAAVENEIKKEEEEEEEVDERILDTMPMKVESEESKDLLRRLAIETEPSIIPTDDAGDIEGLQRKLSCYSLLYAERVLRERVQSLEIHPANGKKLVIAGSINGSIGLWDLESGGVLNFQPHQAPVNCISVSDFLHSKIFSTSHDGSLLCWDLEKTLFSNVYATDFSECTRHLTWHDQMDANTLLLSHGNGRVGLVDLRMKGSVECWYPCFSRSARTVHHHPTNQNYFLVSSGAGCSCNVYDLRTGSKAEIEPVSEMVHSKGLTSAFFSPSGQHVLSTANDDFIRVYSSPLNTPTVKKAIPHNNSVRPVLSVFKAKWYPGRDDAFHVGSLLNPRRIQVYGLNGKLIAELKDEEMTTITSVIATHPTLPLIAGGNNSGTIFVFSLSKTFSF